MKLNNESVFIYPTDTVWGIGASIYSQDAKKKISDIKGSPEDKPLSIMFTEIEEIFKSFDLPKEISAAWLKTYFSMESTLGLPLSSAKISIPSWVTGKSDIVSIRCVDLKVLKEIGHQLAAPFFTTSLNLTGHPPIVSFHAAQEFHLTHAADIQFFGDSSHDLSGRSSTIVFMRSGGFEVIRAGARLDDIKKHLGLTGLQTA